MQSAQRKIEYKQAPPVERKRVVKMEGNVAYIYNKALEKEKKNKADPRYKRAIEEQKLARQKAKLKQEAAIKEAKENRKKAISTIFVVFLAFCAVALLISRFALICQIGTQNNKLQSNIDNVKNQIEELKADMELKNNLENIQNTAINEFGMKYPEENQKVHLDVD